MGDAEEVLHFRWMLTGKMTKAFCLGKAKVQRVPPRVGHILSRTILQSSCGLPDFPQQAAKSLQNRAVRQIRWVTVWLNRRAMTEQSNLLKGKAIFSQLDLGIPTGGLVWRDLRPGCLPLRFAGLAANRLAEVKRYVWNCRICGAATGG